MLLIRLLCTSDKDLTIKYTDFLAATLGDSHYSSVNIKSLFKHLDIDSNGYIEIKDLKDVSHNLFTFE